MYRDDTNLLNLTLLDDILKDVFYINLAFQKVNADIAKLYAELRTLTISLARRILNQRSLKLLEMNPTTMIHVADLKVIEQALDKINDDFGNSLLSVNSLDFGSSFEKLTTELPISPDSLKAVKDRGVSFIVRLVKESTRRLPANENLAEPHHQR
uniref:Uncharacterized protein n=1 Tax=Bracon brevicornis TaxID=1563983 RepID=A0A6V7J4S0_9HYME